MDEKEIKINGVEYVRKDSIKNREPAKDLKGKKYVIARTESAGVFAGYLDKRTGKETTLLQARRLWHWSGAASLSQLAVDGVSKPNDCKFPKEVPEVTLTETIEIIQVSETARESIAGVPIWEK